MSNIEILRQGIEDFGIEASDKMLADFQKYKEILVEKGASEIKVGLSLYDFLKRPEVTYELLEQIGKAASEEVPFDVKEQCVIMS